MNTNLELPEGPLQRLPVHGHTVAVASQPALEMPYEIEGAEREMTLRDIWRILYRHLWVLIAVTGTVTLAVTAYLALRPDYYEATSRVEIGLESANPRANEDDNRPAMTTADPAYFSTQLQIIRSPMVLGRVIEALQLDKDPIYNRFMARGGRKIRALLHLSFLARKDAMLQKERDEVPLNSSLDPAISASDLQEQARLRPYIEDITRKLTVEPVKEPKALFKDTRLVNIIIGHPSPVLAAKIANGIADALVQANEERKEHAGQVTNRYLAHRIDELKAEIRNDEITLARYSSQHQILSLDPAQNTAVDRLTSLNRQLVDAENARKLAEANYREAKAPDAAAALAESETKQIADAQSKLADLRQKKAQLLVGATEKWPEVQETQQQIAALENFITDTRSHAVSVQVKNLETKYRQELAHENAIRAAYQQQRVVTQTQNSAAVDYRLLQQQIESKKNLVNGYLKRLGENDVAQAAMTNNIRVVEYAAEPERGKPEGPWRLLWIGLAFVLSFSFSAGLAFFLEYVDDSLRSAEEVRTVLQLRAVGAIPAVKAASVRGNLPNRLSLVLAGDAARDGSLLIWEKEANPMLVEAYRRLRVWMLMSIKKPPKSLLVVSALIGEGKTTTAANLAASLAQTGASVLLIDGDLHRRHLSEVFGAENLPGLGDLLGAGSVKEADLTRTVIKHSSGVSVLPAGKFDASKHELLLESANMRALLAIAEATFDHVIIDSPAISACSDGIVLAKNVEGVLFVVRAGKSSREVVRYAQEVLLEIGAPVLGVVLNRLPSAQYGPYYGQYNNERPKAAGASA